MSTLENTAPIAFLDVDGVLNRDVSNGYARKHKLLTIHLSPLGFHRLKVTLDPEDSNRLRRLAEVFELAWGTTWEDDANRLISPRLGLPGNLLTAYNRSPLPSKAPGIVEAADGRRFVWFDDAASEQDHLLVREAGGLLIDVPAHYADLREPGVGTGLTDAHVDRALEWVRRG